MNISVLSVGKIKESFWNEAISEYIKRISPYAKINFIELENKAFKDSENAEVIKKQEAELILNKLEKNPGIVLALDEHEKEFSSREFSKFLEQKTAHGDHIIFVLGGPRGLHSSVLEKANQKISLSQMTFPHNLAKVVLIEQLYRAITIMKEKSYHY
jgi:23S rRNA (pseudouridine1915-N3)-methyltransferase